MAAATSPVWLALGVAGVGVGVGLGVGDGVGVGVGGGVGVGPGVGGNVGVGGSVGLGSGFGVGCLWALAGGDVSARAGAADQAVSRTQATARHAIAPVHAASWNQRRDTLPFPWASCPKDTECGPQ